MLLCLWSQCGGKFSVCYDFHSSGELKIFYRIYPCLHLCQMKRLSNINGATSLISNITTDIKINTVFVKDASIALNVKAQLMIMSLQVKKCKNSGICRESTLLIANCNLKQTKMEIPVN